MKPFQWGDYEDFKATDMIRAGTELAQNAAGAEFVHVDLGEEDGEGFVEYLCTPDLRVAVFDCSFRTPHTLLVQDNGWVRLNFSLDLNMGMGFGKRPVVQVMRPSWQLLSMPPDELVIEEMPAHVRLQWVTVCCRPERLSDLAGIRTGDLPIRLTGAPTPEDGIVHQRRAFTPSLESSTMDIVARPRPRGGLGTSFVATKANELVILGLDHLLHQQMADAVQVRLSGRDIEALHDAREILERNLRQPPTIHELSQRLALNRNKLFYGFKSLFGVSVSEHLQACRIGEGHRLVSETEMPIAEVSALVGFQHQCNFSTAFKARYGLSPLALRQQRKRTH